jgi:hypothetical protein
MTFIERHPAISAGLAFAAVGVIIAGCYGGKVLLSPVKGTGDVIIKQNDADTRINAQKELQNRYATLAPMCAAAGTYRDLYMLDKSQFNQVNYTGAANAYRSAVEEYNATTQKTLYQGRLGDLPSYVDASKCPGIRPIEETNK